MNRISVVAPILNEEKIVIPFLERLALLRGLEIVVVDGGSEDQTLSLLKEFSNRHSIQIESAPRGRGRQMNAGVKRTTGEILLFLHADSTLSQKGIDSIFEVMEDPVVVGGAFRLKIDSSSSFLKGVAWAANLRSHYLGLPYGDQGIFVRRETFQRLTGYAELPLMEDVDFIRRLRKLGHLVILEEAVLTSPRRWNQEGSVFATLRNLALLALYLLGIPPRRLAKWYSRS